METHNIKHTIRIITAAIDMFVKNDLGEIGLTLFNEMETKYNIKPDIITTNCIISYLMKQWEIEKVFELISPFINSSHKSEERMWIILLHSCSELNDPEKCKILYQVLNFSIENCVHYLVFILSL